MVKNCETCKYSRKYNRPSFLDGHYVGEVECMTCVNKSSMRWYRKVNNLISCSEWEKIENGKTEN